MVALRIAPDLLSRLAAQIAGGSILITGTNGKTTTARMVAAMLQQSGFSPLANATGSNLLRGLTTTLMAHASITGRLRAADSAVGLFEVDEAVLPLAISAMRPQVVAINNLFRDQLDRYGEVDRIAALWREAVASLPKETTVVLNADDPTVAALGSNVKGRLLYFGVDDQRWGRQGLDHAADVRRCPACNRDFVYKFSFYGHVGHYRCPQCSFQRPHPHVSVVAIESRGMAGSRLRAVTPKGGIEVTLGIPGLYNVYNAAAAIASGLALGLPVSSVMRGLEGVSAAFGRLERVQIDGRNLCLALAKNPTGLNQILSMLQAQDGRANLVFILNDQIADGRDVSWIWDVDFEGLAGQEGLVVASGRRAEDMALRLKYAGIGSVAVERAPDAAMRRAIDGVAPGESVYVLPTYTAMLQAREALSRWGHLPRYWEQQ